MKIILLLGLLPFFLISCGTRRYEANRNVRVMGIPETDFYLVNQRSFGNQDGYYRVLGEEYKEYFTDNAVVYVGKTDIIGVGVLNMSTKDFKRSKKRVYALKDGYIAQQFKLKRCFNASVLADIIFPIAFFFDHGSILSEKKVNGAYLREKSEYNCYDYFVLAMDEKEEDKKMEYLRLAVTQDYRNHEGIKTLALKEIMALQIKNEELHEAFLTLNEIVRFDSDFEVGGYIDLLKDAVSMKNNRKLQKEEKWNRIYDSMNTWGTALTDLGKSMEEAGLGIGGSADAAGYGDYSDSGVPLTNSAELEREKQKLQQLLWERERLIRQRSNINRSISSEGLERTKRTGGYLRANQGKMRPGQGNYGKGAAEMNIQKVTDNRVELRNINKRIEQCQQRIWMYENGGVSSEGVQRNRMDNKSKGSVTGSDLNALHADQRTYESYETQLLNMKNGQTQYNDSERRRIQTAMKSIRSKWEQRGQVFPHSSLENWLGK